jgi:hypothetical protein
VRLRGSLSFIAANFGSRLVIGAVGPEIVLPLLVAATSLMVVAAHL